MEKKRILIFEAYPFFSGSQRITLNVCRILKSQGFYTTLLLVDDRYGNIARNFDGYVDEIKYVKAYKGLLKYGDEDSWFSKKTILQSVFLGLMPFYLRCLKLINLNNYDYLYCCDPRGATMMLLPALFFRKTSILHFHGKNRLPEKLSKLFLKVFTHTLCVSKDVLDSLPPSPKKKVVYNGIDFSQYSGAADTQGVAIEAETLMGGLSSQYTKFLYAGLMRPHKGVHHLIKSFVAFLKATPQSNAVLFLCGAAKTEAEEGFRDYLKNYCEENGVSNKVFWMGWRSDVMSWMNYADYFVFPTIDKEENTFKGFGQNIESTEGLPTVLIESSICSLFNIAADVTGVKEIISPGKNGLIYKNDGGSSLYDLFLKVEQDKPKYMGFPNRENFALETFEKEITLLFK